MIKVSNRKVIRNIAYKSYKANRARNRIAIVAIILTTILFTSLFTIGTGIIESIEESNMRMAGSYAHGSFKYLSQEQYDKLSKHPLIKEVGQSISAGEAVNDKLLKRRTEIDYSDETSAKLGFILPTTGRLPADANEISTDTITLDFLEVPHEIGQKVTLLCDFGDRIEEKDFILTGYYEGDAAFQVGIITVSKAFIEENLKGRGQQYYKDYDNVGSIQAHVLFKNSYDIYSSMAQVIIESGYTPVEGNGENTILYGVNWSYLSTAAEGNLVLWVYVMLGILLIIFTGYLIIYNIFQISVIQDIRFYGLLKTVGTAKKQITRIILLQALRMSAIGIPIGLVAGYLMGKVLLPLILKSSNALVAKVSINPVIFIGSALFALFTVLISCRKPAKAASLISPVEAVKYSGLGNNNQGTYYKSKKGTSGGKLYKMAFLNLGRNKKRTLITVVSISLSLVLLNSVFTLTESFDMNKFISNFIDVDFQIAHAAYYKYEFSKDTPVPKTMTTAIEGQESFDDGGMIYYNPEETIVSKYSGDTEYNYGKIKFNDSTALGTSIYAMDDFVLENLDVIKGKYDKEKFQSGNYVLLGLSSDDKGNIVFGGAVYEIGEKVKIKAFEGSSDTNFGYAKEYEVMGYYRLSNTNCSRTYGTVPFVMPLAELKTYTQNPTPMTYICNAKDGREDELEAFIRNYTEAVEIQMSYNSRETYKKEFTDLKNMFVYVGGILCLIIGIIGILNFINSVFTSIITRQREFAMVESIGMTKRQLKLMLIYEGIYCGLYTILISAGLSVLFGYGVILKLANVGWFMSFKFTILPLTIAYPILIILSVLIPYFAFRGTDKLSIVERLRVAE